MKILLFCLLVFFTSPAVWGQVKVAGKIAASDGKPIPAVNVLLLNPSDTSLIKGCITNESGEYEMDKIIPGRYFLKYTAVGFRAYNSPVFELTNPAGSKNFGTQVMDAEATSLQEVIVRADVPLYQQQIEGMVINVEKSVFTKGSSALQVLERSPGVYVDHHHGIIALNGKNGVLVMINGKVIRMPLVQVVTMLNSMSADNIEKIELLTTPPAKYDAEGDAGMINIVLKKNRKYGTNGSFSLSAGYGWREKASGSINLDHNTGKVSLYGSYSFSHDRGHQDWFATGVEDLPLLGGHSEFIFWSDIHPVQNNHNAIAGFSARLNPTTTIGSNINFNHSGGAIKTYNNGDYILQYDSLLHFKADIHEKIGWKNVLASVFIEKKLKQGAQINFDIDYLYYNNNSPASVLSSTRNESGDEIGVDDSLFSPRQRGLSDVSINVGVFKMDYIRQLSKKVKLEAGIKGTHMQSSGYSGIESFIHGKWTSLYGKSGDIEMKESIGAAYASVNAQINTSTSLVIGARYEHSYTRMDGVEKGENIISRKLGSLFPSLFFTKKLSDNADLQMSYTKRISRPSYTDLASFITYLDPIAVFTGNPLLKPTITNNLKVGYNYKGYSFSVLLGRDDHPIARYQTIASASKNLMNISPQNLAYQNNLVFDIKLPWKVGDWWDMNYGFVGGWKQFKLEHTKYKTEKTYFGYSAYSNQTFKLPKNYTVEISAWYNSLNYNGSIRSKGFPVLNAGAKKELKNNRGSFQLSVSDIFRSTTFNNYLGHLTEEAFLLKSYLNFNPETRKSPIIKLTYSRSFGNSTIKSQRKQDSGSNDERERIKKG